MRMPPSVGRTAPVHSVPSLPQFSSLRTAPDRDSTAVRKPEPDEITNLLKEPFHRGRILDQNRHEGASRDFHYLVYREPDGSIYALLVTQVGREFKIVIPETPKNPLIPYLWDYDWTN